jgi:uncharacterized protein (DUF58 family)
VALLGSWLFGSPPLAPVGIALLVAGTGALAWRRLAARSVGLERRLGAARLVEGDELVVALRLTGRGRRWGRAVAHETVGGLGELRVPLVRGRGELRVPGVPRGRREVGPARVVLEDPLGLERAEAVAPSAGAVVVRPRVEVLESVFTDGGADGFGGLRARLRRPAGTELHSVRDYREGEPLRLVHWPTTARRGELTVLDLQDAPRDQVVVVLDGDPRGVAGAAGRTSFDEAVRVVASLVRASAARRRPVAVAGAGHGAEILCVTDLGVSWETLLDVLASVDPDEHRALSALLADPRLGPTRSAELVLVTCRPEALDVPAVRARPPGAVVLIDAPTYAGAAPSPAAAPLLRLSGEGTPVAVVRAGLDLATALRGDPGAARIA